MEIGTAAIVDFLGIRKRVRTSFELHALILAGLPKTSLLHVATWISGDPRTQEQVIHQIMSVSAYRRRRSKRLTLVESDSLARVVATAAHVWNNKEKAGLWLTTSHPLLMRETPIESASTDPGALRVTEILWSLFFELPGDKRSSKKECSAFAASKTGGYRKHNNAAKKKQGKAFSKRGKAPGGFPR